MASLQRIRSHGALLLIIVGIAMLAFIMGDFMNSGSSFFNRSREYVGTIAGEKIHITDYENAREQLTEVYKIESGRNDFDEETQANINQQVWQMMVAEHTLAAQAGIAGLTVTDEELSNLCIGENPHQLIRQRRVFADQSGQFNRIALIQFLANLELAAEDPEQAQNMKQAQTYWMYWEKAVRLTYMQEKYTDLLKKLVGANQLDALQAIQAGNTTVSAQFVSKPYFAVADSLVKVGNADLKRLYNERKEQYKQEPNRTINYIAFDIVPSEQDFADAEKWINDLKEEFTTTDDIAGVTNSNSDILYSAQNFSENTIPAEYKDWAFQKGRKAGDVTEITFENNTYAMARLVENGYSLPDSVQLRYTLLADAAQFDSLQAAWKKGQYGEAQELGWLTETALPKEMAEKAFAGQKNSIFSLPYGTGLQVLQIMDKAAATPKVKLAILSRNVTPSSKTYAALYNEAKQFIVNYNTEDKFNEGATEKNLTITPAYNVQKNANKVNDLKQSRPIIRWAFKAKEGEVSDVFECGEQFIVAVVSEIREGGYRTINDVQGELRAELLKDQKAELIKADLKDVTALEQAAQILDSEIQTAENISLNSTRFGAAGVEPAVIGAAVSLEENELSQPVQGKNGVYVLLATSKKVSETEPDEAAIDRQIQQLSSRYTYSLPYQLINLVEENADITDNRANFY